MITILGGSGFIGSHLARYLTSQEIPFRSPDRHDPSLWEKNLGHVIYCVGLTADFRERPFDTIRAHNSYLTEILAGCHFESFLYLSSTRVYQKVERTFESVPLVVAPEDGSDLYNLSKLLGESLCLSLNHPLIRVARLSNVYGVDQYSKNFLVELIQSAWKGEILLRSSLYSAKDYIAISDVIPLLMAITQRGTHRLYNVASGINISHSQLVESLQSITGCRVGIQTDAPTMLFPPIEIDRIRQEFNFSPRKLLDDLPLLAKNYQTQGT